MRLRFSLLVAILTVLTVSAILGTSSLRNRPANALPAVDLSTFEPGIRRQIQNALAAATAQPDSADTVGELGRTLHAYGRYEEAAKCYQRARALSPNSFKWKYLHGSSLVELGSNEDALRVFKEATDQHPDYLPAWLAVADILLATDRIPIAVELYRKLLHYKNDSPVIHYELGQALADSAPKKAIEHLERAVDEANYFASAHYRLALLYRNLGDTAKADRHLTLYWQYQGKHPSHGDPLMQQVQALNRDSRQLATRAKHQLTMGNLKPAAGLFEQAIRQDPEYASAHAALVFVYWRLGDEAQAKHHYDRAVSIDPRTPESYINYGMLLGSRDRLDEAASVFRKGLEQDPDNATLHTFLGYIRDRQGRYQEAMNLYRQALDLDPNQRRGNYLLGRRLLLSGNDAPAQQHFEVAVADGSPDSLWFLRQIAAVYTEVDNLEQAESYRVRAQHLENPGNL